MTPLFRCRPVARIGVVAILLGASLRPAAGQPATEAPTPPASTAAEPASSAVPVPDDETTRRALAAWFHVLDLGRVKGGSREKEALEAAIRDAPAPWVAGLGEVFLDEWRYKMGDSRLESPRMAWAPPAPPLPPGRRLSRRVSADLEVSGEGRVLSVRITEGTGDTQLDFEVERTIRESRWRPAQRERRWVRAAASMQVNLREAAAPPPRR